MNTKNTTVGLTYKALYDKTLEKEEFIKDVLHWKLVTIWECEWEKMKKENCNIMDFVNQNKHSFSPFSPFEAFFGGRVETFKTCIDDEGKTKLNYVDFTSLYPFINAMKKYPKGHPEIISNDFGSYHDLCNRYFGLIKCQILPPQDLYLPVLPGKYGSDKKLIFTLCNKCASDRESKVKCNHNENERILSGTWFSEELKVAQEMGYKIISVQGIHHFSETTTELFSEYIKLFYKKKLLASGRPANCQSDNDLHDYIKLVKEKENIELHFEDFRLNPPIRQICKLLINSLWGRFGLRRNLPAHMFVTDSSDVFEIMDDPANQITNIISLHENMALMTYQKSSISALEMNNDANVYIAAITTAYARIELYKQMNMLKERVVYCDTDSIIYIDKEGENLKTGPFLGELTNELSNGDHIVRFISGVPKTMHMRQNREKSV